MSTLGMALDPPHLEESKEVEFLPARFRPDAGETGAVKYRLAQPGIVRVYIRPRKRRFLTIRTLADWEPQQAGGQSPVWDGKDERGNVLNPALYCAVVQCHPLRGAVHRGDLPLDGHLHHEEVMLYEGQRIHAHTLHEVDKCRQLKIDLVAPAAGQKLSGTYRLTMKVKDDARGYRREVRHSARCYVDCYLLHEHKDADGPVANWDWDTRSIPSGMHVLSLACCDHHDYMASDSVVVEIEKP